jgi:hypothetical protein
MPGLDNSLQLLMQGYGFLPNRVAPWIAARWAARLGGMRATALEGPDAARFFYDEGHVRRAGAIPEPVQAALFGKGAVHTLDGEEHRVRKAMFVALHARGRHRLPRATGQPTGGMRCSTRSRSRHRRDRDGGRTPAARRGSGRRPRHGLPHSCRTRR